MLNIDNNNLFISTIADNVVDIAKNNNCGIEIAYFSYAENMDRYFLDTEKNIEKCLFVTNNVVFHAPFYEISMAAIDTKAKEMAKYRLNQFFDLSKKYNPRKLVFHTGFIPSIYYPEWFIPHTIEFLNEYIKDKDIEICIENVLEDDPKFLYDILSSVKSNKIKMCLDVGHVNVYSKKIDNKKNTDLALYWIEKLSPYISHYHIHNNMGDKDRHLDIDEGNLDIKKIVDYAISKNKNATFTLEILNVH